MSDEILEHPLVRVIRRVMKPGVDEPFVIDADGAALIQHGLLRYADDPTLPEAVLGVYAMITGLYRHARSPTAACTLLEILGACRSKLPALANVGRIDARRRLEVAFSSLQALAGDETGKRAPAIDSPAPGGALKASSFTNPGMQRPPGR